MARYVRDNEGWGAFLLSPQVARVSRAAAEAIRHDAAALMEVEGHVQTRETVESFRVVPELVSDQWHRQPRWGAVLENPTHGIRELEFGHLYPRSSGKVGLQGKPNAPLRRTMANYHNP